MTVLSGIGKALITLGQISEGNIGVILTAFLEFFGVDTGLLASKV